MSGPSGRPPAPPPTVRAGGWARATLETPNWWIMKGADRASWHGTRALIERTRGQMEEMQLDEPVLWVESVSWAKALVQGKASEGEGFGNHSFGELKNEKKKGNLISAVSPGNGI